MFNRDPTEHFEYLVRRGWRADAWGPFHSSLVANERWPRVDEPFPLDEDGNFMEIKEWNSNEKKTLYLFIWDGIVMKRAYRAGITVAEIRSING